MDAETKVLVGRKYGGLSFTWREWDTSFDETVKKVENRRRTDKVSAPPDEVIEVRVLRRARLRSEVVAVDIEDYRESGGNE